jgi:hypothetical protein
MPRTKAGVSPLQNCATTSICATATLIWARYAAPAVLALKYLTLGTDLIYAGHLQDFYSNFTGAFVGILRKSLNYYIY